MELSDSLLAACRRPGRWSCTALTAGLKDPGTTGGKSLSVWCIGTEVQCSLLTTFEDLGLFLEDWMGQDSIMLHRRRVIPFETEFWSFRRSCYFDWGRSRWLIGQVTHRAIPKLRWSTPDRLFGTPRPISLVEFNNKVDVDVAQKFLSQKCCCLPAN
ncbi:hypothetical protein NA56DRAFT_701191 [Hyaloscypha hepaticicola]|uniref:Uncharacterized protein n=1 Tax=Hyaloscypha hepaticicola TaxID=2082293 RepID=A0A2J6QBZ2_9HELO|nr:hypothetical protein NA56DRAFT_701191 [Hyaloscypha hepaticicola]